MRPAVRTQIDGLGDLYSNATGLDTSRFPSLTRQEFKDEADINKLLNRFGVTGPLPGQLPSGTVDYDMDLQQALNVIDQAKMAHATLPNDLREMYPTWTHLLRALDKKELTIKLGEPPIPAAQPSQP